VNHFILDASIALACFIDNPVPGYAIQVRQAILKGDRALVPALWHLQTANGLVVAERPRILTAADAARSLGDLEQLATAALETRSELVLAREAFGRARSFHLSAYDSVYLDLARTEGLPLATLDRELRTAAAQAGVELFR
jgi:predicted nucleic acid-binding protein